MKKMFILVIIIAVTVGGCASSAKTTNGVNPYFYQATIESSLSVDKLFTVLNTWGTLNNSGNKDIISSRDEGLIIFRTKSEVIYFVEEIWYSIKLEIKEGRFRVTIFNVDMYNTAHNTIVKLYKSTGLYKKAYDEFIFETELIQKKLETLAHEQVTNF